MKISLDTDRRVLSVDGNEEIPLYGAGAFEILSREWVRVGWALKYYHTFRWMGHPVLQLPEDLVRLQETIWQVRPDVILETGIFCGGSLLFHATLCEALGNGRVIGIDKEVREEARKAVSDYRLSGRIEIIEGDSVATSTVEAVKKMVLPGESVMVILDSHHSAEHVGRELEAYAGMVTAGSCVIVTDGIMRDLMDVPGGETAWKEDNPATAAWDFLKVHAEFEMRAPAWITPESPLRNDVTYWPDGWLWRR